MFKLLSITKIFSRLLMVTLLVTSPLFFLNPSTALAAGNNLTRISIKNDGSQASGHTEFAALSANGRYSAFWSDSPNLVQNDTNGQPDIFLRDNYTGTVQLVSRSSTGVISNGFSAGPSVSPDGRYVVYWSNATNLVPDDTNGNTDVFVFDSLNGTTSRESVASDGTQGNSSSGNQQAFITADGRYVAFVSQATNLVPSDTNGNAMDILLRDRVNGTTKLIDTSSSNIQANRSASQVVMTPDGRYISFVTNASNLLAIDTNTNYDVYVKDLVTNTLKIANVTPAGLPSISGVGNDNPAYISDDGSKVAFSANSTDLTPGITSDLRSYVFMRDLNNNTTSLVSKNSSGVVSSCNSNQSSISPNGRYVAYSSCANNLISGDNTSSPNYNIFLWDSTNNVTKRVSNTLTGSPSNGLSHFVFMNTDASVITFGSFASNLVANDTNSAFDIFMYRVPDAIAPLVTGVPDRMPNANGWYNANVTINWNSVDQGSNFGIPSDPPDTTANVEGSNITYTSQQSCDYDNNCATGTLNLSIDKTKPTITASVSPLSNAGSWNNTDVTVTFSCNDSLSGIDSCSPPVTVSAEGANQSVTGTAIDKAGNLQNTTVSVSLDKTAPSISATLSQGLNTYGWANNDVIVSYNCNDLLSGVKACESQQIISSEGANQTITGTVIDNADNTSQVATSVSIDKTAPIITASVSSTPNTNGWNNSDTTVTFNCSDGLSGIDSCTQPVTISSEGTNQAVIGTAVDKAGNTKSVTVYVNLDKTAPVIGASLSQMLNTYGWANSDLTISYECNDTLSGIETCQAPATVNDEGADQLITGFVTDKAGNTALVATKVSIDKTLPNITASTSTSANTDGWWNADVMVSFNCSDSLAGVLSCSEPVNLSAEGSGQSISGSVTDKADNTATASVNDINIDKTAPTIFANVSPSLNAYGWTNNDTTISYGCNDALSGVKTCQQAQIASSEGTNQTFGGNVVDHAGNSTQVSTALSIDKTAPNITASVDPAANMDGWNNSAVTVTFTCSDALSGVDSCTGPVTIDPEGANQTVTGTAVDKAGNTHSVTVDLNIDKTNPTITASLSSTPNSGGWNNGDVTITFSCADGLSGVKTCSAPVTLTNEGNGQIVTGAVTDKAGNSSSVMAVVNIDKTKPTIAAVITPAPNSNGWNNTNSTVSFTCSDSLSGVASCSSPVMLTAEGANQAVTGIAVDNAGNNNSVSTTVNIDKTAPLVNSVNLSSTLLLIFQPITVTAGVSDTLSGINSPQGGEFYVDNDPGVGNGTSMNYSNGNITGTISSNPGSLSSHRVYVRTKDKAGNWSSARSASFTIVL